MDDTNVGKDTGLKVWDMVVGAALRIPGARVDREKFLRSAFFPHLAGDVVTRAIESTPAKAGITDALRTRVVNSSVKWHRAGVTATSAAAGLPGGWWLAGTLPADLTQYFWHVIVLSQKLAYLHGWPELLEEGEEIDDESKLVLTLFVGAALGVEGAAGGLNRLAAAVGAEAAKRLPRAPLTKYAIYNLAKHIAKWIGIRFTKKKFAEFVGRAIPLVGGAVAGSITWVVFGKSAERLAEHLRELSLAQS